MGDIPFDGASSKRDALVTVGASGRSGVTTLLPQRTTSSANAGCQPLAGASSARPEGFEPPTPRFEAWCSIQLSYGRLLGAV